MASQEGTEVFQLTEEYRKLHEQWNGHKELFDWIVEQYGDEFGNVLPSALVEVAILVPARVRNATFHAQALLSDLQLSMEHIDNRKLVLDQLITDANNSIDYKP
ncbi:hypothetical protein PP101_22 [Pectobacterium phage PP101]|uniref:Uncharacterized protein n=1 Tax=Pectobacterium phage PP101 TaxID=1916414 RepID=A0A1J0MEW3_9CAUD|nr:hypothetical protein HOR42_gp22 [Pectobacterium phage PP101]APD19684.1 hypothetical protein PP101_22 [Pectobacterium phage PP101]